MATIKRVELDDNELLQLVRKGRLNGQFVPIAKGLGVKTLWQVIPELSASALRMLCGLLQDHDDDHVKYVLVSPHNSRDLRLLELNEIVHRLSAAQYERRKGFTTVLLSPDVVRTRDPKVLDLWSKRGLSTEQEELQH